MSVYPSIINKLQLALENNRQFKQNYKKNMLIVARLQDLPLHSEENGLLSLGYKNYTCAVSLYPKQPNCVHI